MAYQRIDEDPALKLHLRMVDTGAHDPRRYNRPTREEIAGTIRVLIVEHRGQGFQRVSELHPTYFPMPYPYRSLQRSRG